MEERKAKPKPFGNSLSALAQVAMRECSAAGYAFFHRAPESHQLVCHDSSGVEITSDSAAKGSDRVVAYQLGTEGILAFVFEDPPRLQQVRPQLDRIVSAIDSVWLASRSVARYSELASQVADLESRLMDSKIADRVRGVLGNRGESETIEAILRHVEGVLRPASTGHVLQQMSRELEEEVEERRLTNRAKVILRSVHGMTEQQAHAHLRQISRKTRRKLRDVAVDVIENHPPVGKVS